VSSEAHRAMSHSHHAHGGHDQDHAHDHAHDHDEPHNDIVYPWAVPFVLMHLSVLGIYWTGVTRTSLILAVVLYLVRMWAITAGFHRYFSHRSYRTSRGFQFVLAFLGQTSAQRGVLWWSAIHRHHHRHSDTPLDVHSPKHAGFWYSHLGWIFHRTKSKADYSTVQDLAVFPELRWLDRRPYFPAFLLALLCLAIDGWAGLFVGFFLSTVVLYHGVFAINSLAHVVGKRRYVTADDSRNNWWLALITLGEGWHNNHHHYQSSTRQGFFWWEIDISYYVLKALSWVGVVWDLRAPPESVVRGEVRLGRKVIEQAARQVAGSFSIDELAADLRAAWAQRPGLQELRIALEETREEALQILQELHLPELPSIEEIRRRIAEQYADSPSLDEIAARAREILLEELVHLLGEGTDPALA